MSATRPVDSCTGCWSSCSTWPRWASIWTERVPTISRFFGISIAMYFDDRGFPHFHACDASGQAKIRIDEVEVIESAMQTRQLRLVLA